MLSRYVGKRLLVRIPGVNHSRYGANVIEAKILEASPSGNYVKLLNIWGEKFWKATSEITFIEELKTLAEKLKEDLEDRSNG